MRDARAEAAARLGGRYEVRVLEPSPPAVDDGEWFADDPAVRADASAESSGEAPLVSPTGDGDLTWSEVCSGDAELEAWAADRWLGCYRRLAPLPSGFVEARLALQDVALHVVSAARKAVNGKIGLRYAHGGFGTPWFGDDVQVRVEAGELVLDTRSRTVRAALAVDRGCATALGEWYGFAASVLERLRFELRSHQSVSRVQLWPEHFDMAFDDGTANFGCSPGDDEHPEPYVYVGPWDRDGLAGEYWNASFGAVLGYDTLLEVDDQRAAALTFLSEGVSRLRSR